MSEATAVAHANIALTKYWGKAATSTNTAAVPSLSMTLDALHTTTRVRFDPSLSDDVVRLSGVEQAGRPRDRVVALLDEVRARSKRNARAEVHSENSFPTAAGLASSASGFAALAVAAARAADWEATPAELSALARRASVSAARSIYGGYVTLDAGADAAERVAPKSHFPLAMAVVLTTTGPKSVSSTEGMKRTMATSPYYAGWVSAAPALHARARSAILDRDLATLGDAVERSALMMHASMFAANPPLVYFNAVTLAVMERVRALRTEGNLAFFTMDAGPHVKVLVSPDALEDVASALETVGGVERVIRTGIGPDAHVLEPGS